MFTHAAKVMSWINWIQMLGLGIYSIYISIDTYDKKPEPTRIVLAVYLTLFGMAGLLFEGGVKALVRKFGFLETPGSKGWFFFFAGTLGLSFGWYTKPAGLIVPFVLGLFSIVSAIILWLHSCESGRKGRGGGGREDGEYSKVLEGAAPSRI